MVCSVYHNVCLKLMRLDLYWSVFSFHFLPDIEDEACGLAKPIESHISTSAAPEGCPIHPTRVDLSMKCMIRVDSIESTRIVSLVVDS